MQFFEGLFLNYRYNYFYSFFFVFVYREIKPQLVPIVVMETLSTLSNVLDFVAEKKLK